MYTNDPWYGKVDFFRNLLQEFKALGTYGNFVLYEYLPLPHTITKIPWTYKDS
jgi:hypothetical protein